MFLSLLRIPVFRLLLSFVLGVQTLVSTFTLSLFVSSSNMILSVIVFSISRFSSSVAFRYNSGILFAKSIKILIRLTVSFEFSDKLLISLATALFSSFQFLDYFCSCLYHLPLLNIYIYKKFHIM